jgi:hypothetical protein
MIVSRALRRLSRRDLRLLSTVFVGQVALGVALRVASVRVLSRAIAKSRVAARRMAMAPEERIAWAIEAVGRRLPWISTCLVRALAADLFLGGPNRPGHVKIGVRRSHAGTLESHAWFECDGRIVVGAAGAHDYVTFMILDS